MRRVSSGKKKPVYPEWSERCEHAHGISFEKAFKRWNGNLCFTLETMRKQIVDPPPELGELSERNRKQMLSHYWAAIRTRKVGFAELVAKDHFYTSGIRWPFAEDPVREHIPPELWPDFVCKPEKNRARGWSPLEERYVTYVDIRVSARFWHSPDYDRVALRNLQFRLNETQSQIVCRLHKALLQGEHEGLVAKQLLPDLGKKSTDISDYFHDQDSWRELIVRTKPGRYRLNAYGRGY